MDPLTYIDTWHTTRLYDNTSVRELKAAIAAAIRTEREARERLEADVAFLRRRRGELVIQRDEVRRRRRAAWTAWREAEVELATEREARVKAEAERDEAIATAHHATAFREALDEAKAEVARLREALVRWDEAFATGRSEPLFIARDAARAELTQEPKP